MKLEYRTCELIEEKNDTKVYKLKCTLKEAFQLNPYIIEQEPIVEYKLTKWEQYEWVLGCLADDPYNGVVVKRNGQDVDIYDQHMTFIIPEYWENKGLKEGFYEAGEYPNTCQALKHYVRRDPYEDDYYDYVLQEMGGAGDPEYTYLKMLCEINDTFIMHYDDIVYNHNGETEKMMEGIVPLNVRTCITVEVPKEMDLK